MSLEIFDVEFWVKEALKSEKIYDLEVFQHSKRVDSANYQADLMFVTAKGVKTDGKEATYELLVKMGKQNKELRNTLPLRIVYEREVFVYGTVIPGFKYFQKEKSLPEFNLTPRCYGTFLTEDPDQEIVVMENIQKLEFELHDRAKYFNKNHVNLTLEAYAYWHSLSLAFRDQHPKKFADLFSNLTSPLREYLDRKDDNIFSNTYAFILEILVEREEDILVRKIIDYDLLFAVNLISSKIETDDRAVFVHGDCWRENFMFKYKINDQKNNPQEVKMLDFQMSTLGSLTWDLANHLYCVLPLEDFKNITEYLKKALMSKDADENIVEQTKEKINFRVVGILNHWFSE